MWKTDGSSVLHQITILKLLTQHVGRLLGTHQWQSALLVVGLPVTQDWFKMGWNLSPSLISTRLTAAVPPFRGRGWVTTNKQAYSFKPNSTTPATRGLLSLMTTLFLIFKKFFTIRNLASAQTTHATLFYHDHSKQAEEISIKAFPRAQQETHFSIRKKLVTLQSPVQYPTT